jgi:hypothetical protein
MSPTYAEIRAGEAALIAEGGAPGSSLHSWRCEYPDRDGRAVPHCDCVVTTVEEILKAAERAREEAVSGD